MYEAFFHLQKRPFLATPDATCFYAAEPTRDVFDELTRQIQAGPGINILTAPAGTGKTLLCRRLVAELRSQFTAAFIASPSFPTRRALLQAILYELGERYSGLAEQELRLELHASLKKLSTSSAGTLIVIDEAHLLSERLLEEVRAIADLVDYEIPLTRVVLSGQPELEERLVSPGLEAFNQRITAQVYLEPLTRQQSFEYIATRVEWAGGDAEELFDSAALRAIAHACNGLPRCLNQLCDLALVLACTAKQPQVTRDIVDQALADLRSLPLHWNERFVDQSGELEEVETLHDDAGDFDRAPTATDSVRQTARHSAEPLRERLGELDEEELDEEELEELEAEDEAGHEIDSELDRRLALRAAGAASAEPQRPASQPIFEVSGNSVSFEIGAGLEASGPLWTEPANRAEATEANPAADLESVTRRDGREVNASLNSEQEADIEAEVSEVESAAAEDYAEDCEAEDYADLPDNEVDEETSRRLPFSFAERTRANPPTVCRSAPRQTPAPFEEETVVDRYAAIDAGRPPATRRVMEVDPRTFIRPKGPSISPSIRRPDQTIEALVPLLESVCSQEEERPPVPADAGSPPEDAGMGSREAALPTFIAEQRMLEQEIGQEVLETCREVSRSLTGSWQAESSQAEEPGRPASADGGADEGSSESIRRFDGVQSVSPLIAEYDIVEPEDLDGPASVPEAEAGESALQMQPVQRPTCRGIFSLLRRRQSSQPHRREV